MKTDLGLDQLTDGQSSQPNTAACCVNQDGLNGAC